MAIPTDRSGAMARDTAAHVERKMVAVALVLRRSTSPERAEFWSRVHSVRRLTAQWCILVLLLPVILVAGSLAAAHLSGGLDGDPLAAARQTAAQPAGVVGFALAM